MTDFVLSVDRSKLFNFIASSNDKDEAVAIAGRRIVEAALAGEVSFREAVVLELAGMQMKQMEGQSDGA